jgi:peptide-methionine (S)-S-oxide reductase
MTTPLEKATLGGGCFWCLEAVYDDLAGVESVESGYMGGRSREPSYEEVCGGDSGHAEVVRVTFDPAVISFREILQVFFVIHDPTTLNRQGNDEGTQYRSAIFYADAQQKRIAEAYIAQLDKARVFRKPIVTRVDALKGFYPAEAYHQDFLLKNPSYPYIVINDLPKIANLKTVFPTRYLDQPVTAQSSR